MLIPDSEFQLLGVSVKKMCDCLFLGSTQSCTVSTPRVVKTRQIVVNGMTDS